MRRICVPDHDALRQYALLNYTKGHAVEQGEDTVEVGNRDASGLRFTPLEEAHIFIPNPHNPNECNVCHHPKQEGDSRYDAATLRWEIHKERVLGRGV